MATTGVELPSLKAGTYTAWEPKGCENCPRTFIRRVGSRDKYCHHCHAKCVLEAVGRNEYVDTAPRLRPPHKAIHRQEFWNLSRFGPQRVQ